jgi:hypothetical protein
MLETDSWRREILSCEIRVYTNPPAGCPWGAYTWFRPVRLPDHYRLLNSSYRNRKDIKVEFAGIEIDGKPALENLLRRIGVRVPAENIRDLEEQEEEGLPASEEEDFIYEQAPEQSIEEVQPRDKESALN